MLLESVRNMVSLSTPRPQPPVGGRPYSSAVAEVLVQIHRLVVPARLVLGLLLEPAPLHRRVVQLGVGVTHLHTVLSLGSVTLLCCLLHTSFFITNSSNLSVSPVSVRCHLARGDMT